MDWPSSVSRREGGATETSWLRASDALNLTSVWLTVGNGFSPLFLSAVELIGLNKLDAAEAQLLPRAHRSRFSKLGFQDVNIC